MGGWGVGGWVGGGDVNVHWTCTLTWCYATDRYIATARSLQFTQLRDATLHFLFNLLNYVMLRWLGWGPGGGWVGGDVNIHWTCTLTWCYATARSLQCYATARSLQFTQLRDATLLHVLFNLHNYVMLRYCTFSSIYTTTWCYVDWGGGWGGGWGGMLTFIGLAHLLHVLFNLHHYVMLRCKNARRLTRPRPGLWPIGE